MKILAIGAHPDDIEIFMYGFLAACRKRGDEISLCVATDGAAGNITTNNNLKNIRKKEALKGLAKLGIPSFLELEDGNLAESTNAYKIICDHINNIRPDLVITHDPSDYHPDHRSLSEMVSRSVGFKYPILFAETLLGITFIPEIYVDITEFFEEKEKAILSHSSQNPSAFADAIKLCNRFRSAQCNAPKENYAEVYRSSKTFPFTDMRTLFPPAPKIRQFYQNGIDSLV